MSEIAPLIDIVNVAISRAGGASSSLGGAAVDTISADESLGSLRFMADHIDGTGVMIVSTNKQVLHLNASMEEITGIRAQQAAGAEFQRSLAIRHSQHLLTTSSRAQAAACRSARISIFQEQITRWNVSGRRTGRRCEDHRDRRKESGITGEYGKDGTALQKHDDRQAARELGRIRVVSGSDMGTVLCCLFRK